MVGSRAEQSILFHNRHSTGRLALSNGRSAPAKLVLPFSERLFDSGLQVIAVRPQDLRARNEELANLLWAQWSAKDPYSTLDFYRRQMSERLQNARTPFFVAQYEGRLQGAIFPLRVNELAPNWNELTGAGTWSTDRPDGRILVCPQICVFQETAVGGIPRALIPGSVLLYAAHLVLEGEVERVVAYSRPSNFGSVQYNPGMSIRLYVQGCLDHFGDPAAGYGDRNLLMHLHYGAVPAEKFQKGARHDPAAGEYIVVMDYTQMVRDLISVFRSLAHQEDRSSALTLSDFWSMSLLGPNAKK